MGSIYYTCKECGVDLIRKHTSQKYCRKCVHKVGLYKSTRHAAEFKIVRDSLTKDEREDIRKRAMDDAVKRLKKEGII